MQYSRHSYKLHLEYFIDITGELGKFFDNNALFYDF